MLAAGADGTIALPQGPALGGLAVIGVAGIAAHVCLTTALRLAPAAQVMPVDFLRLPVIVAVGAALYGEALDPWVLAGAALILAGNWVNLRRA